MRLYVASTSRTFLLLPCISSMGSCTQMKYCPPFDLMSVLHTAIFFLFPALLCLPGFIRNDVTNLLYSVFFFLIRCMSMRVGCPARMTDVFEAWETELPGLVPSWPLTPCVTLRSHFIILHFIFLIGQMKKVN